MLRCVPFVLITMLLSLKPSVSVGQTDQLEAEIRDADDALDLNAPGASQSLLSPKNSGSSLVPESAKEWRYPHTTQRVRFGLTMGDHASGPIRYNTHFPEKKGNPHPTSYYHGPAHVGGEIDVALSKGGLIFGALSRYDLAHPGIKGRKLFLKTATWRVEEFEFDDKAFLVGWAFGERYREALWWADLALVYDRGRISATVVRDESNDKAIGRVDMQALSMRSRLIVRLFGTEALNLSAGPEIHVPLWHEVKDKSDLAVRDWFAEHLEYKASAALGLTVMANLIF